MSRELLADTQVCVIGAGIAGLTTAYLLQRAGAHVQVLDAAPRLCAGETGRTTAHLSAGAGRRFLRARTAVRTVRRATLAASSHAAAIDCIEAIVQAENIYCDFERLDGLLVAAEPRPASQAREGIRGHAPRGILPPCRPSTLMRTGEILIDGPTLRFPRQAAFHVGRYMHGLARAFTSRGGHLVFDSRAVEAKGGRGAHVKLDSGARLGAEHIVVATNTPFNDRVTMHTKQAAYRTYVVGFDVPKDAFPAVLIWDMAEPYHYVRRVRGADRDVVIVGGEDHKTGQADDAAERYRRLEQWARARFSVLGATRYRWSGQLMEPVDALGFIGRNPHDQNLYIITGDSGDGMTHGTIGGMLISDLVAGRVNPWESLYDPARKTVKPRARTWARTRTSSGHMVRDWVKGGESARARRHCPR